MDRADVGRRQRGDAIVEFVLVLPILLMLLFGILEVGRVLDTWIVVENAARAGARAGTLTVNSASPGPAAQKAAQDYLQTSLGGRTDIDNSPVVQPTVTSDSVTVAVEADVHIYTPFMQTILKPSLPVRGSAVMPRMR